MKEYRILFTGVGRRVELIQQFKDAALYLGINLIIYGADISDTAPALFYCDITRKVCGMKDPKYIDELLEISHRDKIDLIIPTIDTDLLVLAENVDKFMQIGTRVLISNFDKIKICRDKNLTSDFFISCGLNAPKTYNNYLSYDGSFPCFIKPKDGSSSINAFKVNDQNELKVYAEMIEDYVIQEYIDGIEYTIDVLCDYEGNPIYITPRIRQTVRAGEVLKTKIDLDKSIIAEMVELINQFKPCGPITVQLIKERKTGKCYYIEINPRFGGGAPLSMKAGARSSEAVLRLMRGEKVVYQMNACADNAIYSRFDQSVCIKKDNLEQSLKGIIFDLDDTLYSEIEYVKSGFRKIAEHLNDETIYDKLFVYFNDEKPAIDCVLTDMGKIDLRDECLSIYRNHVPDISLYTGAIEMIKKFRDKGVKIGILTDGRVEGQKRKIEALELHKYVDDIIITDELGGIQFRKPNDISFRIMQNRWKIPFEQMVYVGDNVLKDFFAPRQLGMQTVWFKNQEGLYKGNEKFINITVCNNMISINETLSRKVGV